MTKQEIEILKRHNQCFTLPAVECKITRQYENDFISPEFHFVYSDGKIKHKFEIGYTHYCYIVYGVTK